MGELCPWVHILPTTPSIRFQGDQRPGALVNLGGKNGDVLPPDFEGLYLCSTLRESNAVFSAEVGNMSPTTPQDARPLRRLSIFEGFLPCSPSHPWSLEGNPNHIQGSCPWPYLCAHLPAPLLLS